MSRVYLDQIDIISEDEGENGTDYTMINRGTPPVELNTGSSETSNSDSQLRNSPKSGSFKCSQCFREIELGRPIYMRNDFPYCTKDCRELGVSSIYRALFGSSFDNDAGFVNRLLKQIGGSNASFSSTEEFDDDDDIHETENGAKVAAAARARARSFLNSIVGSMSKSSLGRSFLRTYSNGVLWGKDMTRNSSFNMLFQYLPEIAKASSHEFDNSSTNERENDSTRSSASSL
jgi:hypothetical protein